MKKIVFVYKDWIIGGYELLCLKLAKQFAQYNCSIGIIYDTMDEYFKNRFLELNFELYSSDDWWDVRSYNTIIHSSENVYIFTAVINDYLKARKIKSEGVKTMFFMSSTKSFDVLHGDYLWKLNRILTNRMLEKEIKSGHFVSMDTININVACEKYISESCRDYLPIVYIGDEIEEFSNEEIERSKCHREVFKVLSVARASFPDKGYLIGLVKYFSSLNTDKEIEVTIVSYGNDIDVLKNQIESTHRPDNVDITLKGRMEFEELKEEYKVTNLYIGMGTTLIDAAQYGTVCIPIKHTTYDFVGNDYFHDRPDLLSAIRKENNIDSLIKNLINMEDENYLDMCIRSREVADEYYNIKNTAGKLLDQFDHIPYNKKSFVLNRLFLFRRIMHRIKTR